MAGENSDLGNLLARYRNGDCRTVWGELVSAGTADPGEGAEFARVAREIAIETMARIRRNLNTIIDRLKADEYAFVDTNSGDDAPIEPVIEPDQEFAALACWLDETFGGIPLSVKMFLLEIGEVSLLGRHPCWPADHFRTPDGFSYPDPLVVELCFKRIGKLEQTKRHFLRERQEWLEWRQREGEDFDCPFGLDFAADPVHKAGYSGGSPYRILVPDSRADGLVDLEGPQMLFLDYLREAILVCGGFYGLRQVRSEPTDRLIEYLTEGLEPF